jgi:predicted PurR-regulated permease PerM
VNAPQPRAGDIPTTRAIFRVVAIVFACVFALYLLYLVRGPVGYLVLALFIAVAASGPVAFLARHMRTGFAIAITYVCIGLAPLVIALVLVVPLVEQTAAFVDKLPTYVAQFEQALDDNKRLRELDQDYGITEKLDELAGKAASSIDDAALAVADVGAGLVSSVFAFVTILVLSMFMVAGGPRWVESALATRPARQAEAGRRALENMAAAVAGYVGGALTQALVAGIASFIMLTILGVPNALTLSVLMALLDLIPLVGATLGAVVVGVVTLFADFPLDTLIWTIFAIAYQQFENYVIQPRIQSKASALDPFLVVVAALFGSALLGIVGALLAIPVAGVAQIFIREWLRERGDGELDVPPIAPDTAPEPPPAVAG